MTPLEDWRVRRRVLGLPCSAREVASCYRPLGQKRHSTYWPPVGLKEMYRELSRAHGAAEARRLVEDHAAALARRRAA